MCVFGSKKSANLKPSPSPEAAPEALDVGAARKQEDEALFGGQPSLSVNRDTVAPGVTAGGSGLRMM